MPRSKLFLLQEDHSKVGQQGRSPFQWVSVLAVRCLFRTLICIASACFLSTSTDVSRTILCSSCGDWVPVGSILLMSSGHPTYINAGIAVCPSRNFSNPRLNRSKSHHPPILPNHSFLLYCRETLHLPGKVQEEGRCPSREQRAGPILRPDQQRLPHCWVCPWQAANSEPSEAHPRQVRAGLASAGWRRGSPIPGAYGNFRSLRHLSVKVRL